MFGSLVRFRDIAHINSVPLSDAPRPHRRGSAAPLALPSCLAAWQLSLEGSSFSSRGPRAG